MKKILILALILVSALAQAETITLVEKDLTGTYYPSYSNARFYMDLQTGEGFAQISVTEERYMETTHCDQWGRCYPNRYPMPVTIYEETVKIEGLTLNDKDIMFDGAEGSVNCGKMGVTRITRKPTIYLSGNCRLDSRLTGDFRGTHLKVDFITK